MQGLMSTNRLTEEQLAHLKKLMKEGEGKKSGELLALEKEKQEALDSLQKSNEEQTAIRAKVKKLKELLKLAEKHLGESKQTIADKDQDIVALKDQIEQLQKELSLAAQKMEREKAEVEKRVAVEVKHKAREEFLQQLRKAAQVYKEKMKELVHIKLIAWFTLYSLC